MSLVEAALFVGLNETLRRRPAVYLRYRSLLLSLVFLGHFTASAPAADWLMCAWLAGMSMQPVCIVFGPPWLPPLFVLAAPWCLLASWLTCHALGPTATAEFQDAQPHRGLPRLPQPAAGPLEGDQPQPGALAAVCACGTATGYAGLGRASAA